MDINLLQLFITQIRKFVRHIGRDNDNLPSMCLKGGRANGERTHTFLYDENFFVGVLVQPYATSGWHIYPYERNLSILMLRPNELIGVPIVGQVIPFKNDVIHARLYSFSILFDDGGNSAYACLTKTSS